LTELFAKVEVVFNRFLKGPTNFIDGGALEGYDITSVDYLTVENAGGVIELDFAYVSFVFHHGLIPPVSKNRFTDCTAPLSVSFCGCGL
jgi:hypothetical protein